MSDEDRIGRGGDHIPFRQNGFTAIRFTSANEHGDANVTAPGYSDRQHTSSDVLGVDRDSNGTVDSFFVDFNYLARNAVINGNAAAMAAIGLKTPGFTVRGDIQITSPYTGLVNTEITPYGTPEAWAYAVAFRNVASNDWDYNLIGPYPASAVPIRIDTLADTWPISVAAVDSNGVESLFSSEYIPVLSVKGITPKEQPALELLQNKPNPFDDATTISILVRQAISYKEAYIQMVDAVTGKEVKRLPIVLKKGVAEVVYQHGYHASGTYIYSLVVDGKRLQSRKMVFAN
jgi:hypothetical protein